MKISISGTQCVGKSTLINTIRQQSYTNNLKDVTFIGSKTHELMNYPNMGGFSRKANDLSQSVLFANFIKDAYTPNSISDRSILDNYVYTKYQAFKEKSVSMDLYNVIADNLELLLSQYDYIFYLTPDHKPLLENGIRDTDEKYRMEVHEMFMETINLYSPYISNSTRIIICDLSFEDNERHILDILKFLDIDSL